MKSYTLVFLALLSCVVGLSANACAQTTPASDAAPSTDVWSSQIQDIARSLSAPDLPDEDLPRLRDEVDRIRNEIQNWIIAQNPNVQSIQAEISSLGPPPAEGQQPEADAIAALRRELATRLANAQVPIREAELVLARSNQLTANIAATRRARFAQQVLAQSPSPISPDVWSRALPELGYIRGAMLGSVTRIVTAPDFQLRLRQSLLALTVSVAFAILMIWPLQRWLLRQYGRNPSILKPSYVQALRATLVVGATRSILPTVAATLVYMVVLGERLLTPGGQEIAQAMFLGFILFTWTIGFFRASLSPFQPNWRLIPVPTNFALGVRDIIIGLALVFALDLVLSQIIITFSARLVVTQIRDFALTVIVTGLLLALMLRQQMWTPDSEPDNKPRWRSLRMIGALMLLSLPIISIIGYVTLARFVVTQFVLTGALVLLLLFLHRLGIESLRQGLSTESWFGEQLRTAMSMDDAGTARLEFWAGLAYDAVLILLGSIVGLFLWGADRQDVTAIVYQALFGFRVGEVTFSIANLFAAIALFIALIVLTRILQRMLTEKMMPHTRLDSATAQSIGTVLGYVGVALATVVGISALGLDLSSLAIVAGAFSVGIGFGLQNVVNNFVSGLILLVERPIKVGDWVALGGKEGIVKRIKVRATEIQTFDLASVFVPNSQLISEAVTNFAHPNKLGRVIVPVGVAYGSDTRLVRRTLLDVATAHPLVLREPGPAAVFRGFGDNALQFELRCFLPDIGRIIDVTSDLCFAIEDAFRRNKIEIPFPQLDIHLKQSQPGVSEIPASRAESHAKIRSSPA